MDGSVECHAQTKGCSKNGGGQGEALEMVTVALAWPFTLATERRKERGEPVHRHDEEICYVEAAGYAGPNEGLEGGGSGGREAVVEDGVKQGKKKSSKIGKSHLAYTEGSDIESRKSIGEQGVGGHDGHDHLELAQGEAPDKEEGDIGGRLHFQAG